MKITPLAIADVLLIEPPRFGDDRGWFQETWNRKKLAENGFDVDFVQDNESLSKKAGTVRGLHMQVAPYAQGKLVRALTGAILDVAVDVRAGSPTYGQWVSAELTAENGHQLFVPRGFLHAFRTLVDDTHVAYKVDGFYDKASERGVLYNDPAIGIDWGTDEPAILSDKDRVLPPLAELGPVEF